jgi:FkbM family methyltransferase
VLNYGRWRTAVRELWRFKWRENRQRRIAATYHTRRTGTVYCPRHGTRDTGIFSEICIAGEYQPPPVVAQRHDQVAHPLRILDLGGNIGLFVAFCRDRWLTAYITTVEPDPYNLELLERTAAGTTDVLVIAGERFMPGLFAESHVTRDTTASGAIEVPSIDALRLAQTADLVKIDIEGSEWEILADPRLPWTAATAVVMKWHDEQCPHGNPSQAARAALQGAGFQVVSERIPISNTGQSGPSALRNHIYRSTAALRGAETSSAARTATWSRADRRGDCRAGAEHQKTGPSDIHIRRACPEASFTRVSCSPVCSPGPCDTS